MKIVSIPKDLEFSKETMTDFIDECISIHNSISQSKSIGEVELIMRDRLYKTREKYMGVIEKSLFRSRVGELYAHGYNSINKKQFKWKKLL